MAVQFETLTRIKKWIKDYRSNKYLQNETNSVTIDLDKVEDFLKYIKIENKKIKENNIAQGQNNPTINAIRFYLTRQNDVGEVIPENASDATIVRSRRTTLFYDKNFNDQTQIALVALPVLDYKVVPMPVNASTNELRVSRGVAPGASAGWYSGKDYIIDNSNVKCLYARGQSEHTGMCPYNCIDTLTGD